MSQTDALMLLGIHSLSSAVEKKHMHSYRFHPVLHKTPHLNSCGKQDCLNPLGSRQYFHKGSDARLSLDNSVNTFLHEKG